MHYFSLNRKFSNECSKSDKTLGVTAVMPKFFALFLACSQIFKLGREGGVEEDMKYIKFSFDYETKDS